MTNFDFGEFLNDDNLYAEENEEAGFEEYLTVKALLCLKYGEKRGRDIYRFLTKYARRATADMPGEPGILFDGEGGEFVSFNDNVNTIDKD
jgi:hypothetical protein